MRLVRNQIEQGTRVISQIRQELQRVAKTDTIRKNSTLLEGPTATLELFKKKDLKQLLYPGVRMDGYDH